MGMIKRFFVTLALALIGHVAFAANPAFTDFNTTNFNTAGNKVKSKLLSSNVTYVAKNGNNGTAIVGDAAWPFLTISNAVQASVSGFTVQVAPGTYNECVLLKNGVNLNLGVAVLEYDANNTLPTITDGGVTVICSIDGFGEVRRKPGSSSAARALLVSANSVVTARVKLAQAVGTGTLGAVLVSGSGTLRFSADDVFSGGSGIDTTHDSDGYSSFVCKNIWATNDYGFKCGASGTNEFSGMIHSKGNSAFTTTSSGSWLIVRNSTGISDVLYGHEHAAGNAEFHNSRLQSTRSVDGEGNAISKYGGELLILNDVELLSGNNNTYSIDNQGIGSHGTISIHNPCYADRIPNPEMNIVQGAVLVTNTIINKAALTFGGASTTNMVLQTNGTVSVFGTNNVGMLNVTNGAASYSTTATNAIGGTGYTNNTTIQQTAFVTSTAVAFTIKDRSQATLYVSPTLTATTPVTLQPGWSITAASGLVGTVLPW